ncbi:hypothetical protein B0H11DRAFT_2009814 [Mycena galericulata]|nr:hypothetical protein B0H11DRAFT_2009814 [Mycena galericulata]
MAGGPPPPPPPPTAFRMGGKSKVSRPTKRLLPLFWDKLADPSVASTVWSETPSSIAFVMDDLEANFTIDTTPVTPSKLPSNRPKNTPLLEHSRATNIGIMLSRFKMALPDIKNALLELDDDRLTVEDLEAIGQYSPTLEEIGRIKEFDDLTRFAKADQYFGQIMVIPRFSERLQCMAFRRRLDLKITEIRPELNILRNASHELRSSSKFKQVLQAVLAVGNALNASSYRGGARGFKLDTLLMLEGKKTASGGSDCPTLLHYLARVLMRTDPSMVNFIEDLPSLEAASRIAGTGVFLTVNSLVAGLAQVNEEIAQLKSLKNLPPNDRFIAAMKPFAAEFGPNVAALKNMGNLVDGELRSLMAYYGEDPDLPDATPENFFKLILKFSSSLQKCALDVHDAQMKLNPPARKLTITESQEDKESTVKVGQDPSPQLLAPPQAASQGRSVGRGDLDQAIRSMREGKRRARPTRPLSKIFIDGGRPQSRMYD